MAFQYNMSFDFPSAHISGVGVPKKGPSGFFGATRLTSHLPFTLGMGSHPKEKRGAKKGGSSFYYTDGT